MSEHLLVTIGKDKFTSAIREPVYFLDHKEANDFINKLDELPHAYVLGCLMDMQIKSEKAWKIPYIIKKVIGSFDIVDLYALGEDEYKLIFKEYKLHRFNDRMASTFYLGVKRICDKYNGDASNIWKNSPSSAKVVFEFLQFYGCGAKIATMAANILARQFKIPFTDYYSIDISPDTHVMRVMTRLGIAGDNPSRESIIYRAREIYPEFPGIIDYTCFDIGRNYCSPKKPQCVACPISSICQKV